MLYNRAVCRPEILFKFANLNENNITFKILIFQKLETEPVLVPELVTLAEKYAVIDRLVF